MCAKRCIRDGEFYGERYLGYDGTPMINAFWIGLYIKGVL